jgi:hypothetical protein
MQGIQVPASAVNPQAFFAATRRQNLLFKTLGTNAGFGNTDLIPVLQTGILSHIRVRVFGTLTTANGTGTVASTFRWPYYLIRALRFTANGQSNLINCDGWALRLIALADRGPLDDRGVVNGIGGASPGTQVNQGTMAMSSESWGVGSGVTAIAPGSYDVELMFDIPVAYDNITLLGAIFAQTQSTDLEVAIDWANLSDLFVLTGTATATFTPSVQVEGTVYTIPSVNNGIVIPNLSAFHSLTATRAPNNIAVGNNEITLAGQGVGRKLMRLTFRTMNGTGPSATPQPLGMNATNYAQPYWRFGGNTTPETWADGRAFRAFAEELYNADIGSLAGYGAFDFSSIWAQRDSVDEGSATQLRFGFTIPNGVTLTTPFTEYLQQVIVSGAVAA